MRLRKEDQRSLADAILVWVDSLLKQTNSPFFSKAGVLMDVILETLEPHSPPLLMASMVGRLAILKRRLGDFADAEKLFLRQGQLLEAISVRGRERADFNAALSALSDGRIADGDRTLNQSLATSFHVGADGCLTTMVPEIIMLQSWMEQKRGNSRKANELAKCGRIHNPDLIFNLVVLAALSIQDGDIEKLHAIVDELEVRMRKSEIDWSQVEAILVDFPVFDVYSKDGYSLSSLLQDAESRVQIERR